MIDLQKLQTFRAVAITRSFTRAAVELGYSQSSVTTHIQGLERELGTSLFERCRFSKNIVLTKAGRRALEYAEQLLALAEEAQIAVEQIALKSEPRSLRRSLVAG